MIRQPTWWAELLGQWFLVAAQYGVPMRETVRSLRLYSILSGLASLWFGSIAIAEELRGGISFEAALATASGIGLALAFLYVGVSLSRLLRNSSHRIILSLTSVQGG